MKRMTEKEMDKVDEYELRRQQYIRATGRTPEQDGYVFFGDDGDVKQEDKSEDEYYKLFKRQTETYESNNTAIWVLVGLSVLSFLIIWLI